MLRQIELWEPIKDVIFYTIQSGKRSFGHMIFEQPIDFNWGGYDRGVHDKKTAR